MKNTLEELYQKAAAFQAKYNDEELNDYLLVLARKLEDADMMYHHFGYLMMHLRVTLAHPSRPKHLQEAIARAERYLKRHEEEEA